VEDLAPWQPPLSSRSCGSAVGQEHDFTVTSDARFLGLLVRSTLDERFEPRLDCKRKPESALQNTRRSQVDVAGGYESWSTEGMSDEIRRKDAVHG